VGGVPLRVSNARVDALAGAALWCGAGLAGLIVAAVSGTAPLVYAVVGFAVGVVYRGARSLREWRDDPGDDEAFETLPEAAEIRPRWLVPAWLTLGAPIIVGVAVGACLWSRWGVVAAGGLVGLGVYAIRDWLHLRRWEIEHGGTVYYERTPLIGGGVSARYVRLRRTEESD
jgi:hypothetical protein